MLCIAGRCRRHDGTVEVLVEQAERIGGLPLEHITGEYLRTLGPVIERPKTQCDCPILRRRAVAEPSFLKMLLIFAQAGDNLPDPVDDRELPVPQPGYNHMETIGTQIHRGHDDRRFTRGRQVDDL